MGGADFSRLVTAFGVYEFLARCYSGLFGSRHCGGRVDDKKTPSGCGVRKAASKNKGNSVSETQCKNICQKHDKNMTPHMAKT